MFTELELQYITIVSLLFEITSHIRCGQVENDAQGKGSKWEFEGGYLIIMITGAALRCQSCSEAI